MNTARPPLTVLLAAPRGFCAGVARAVARSSQLALRRRSPRSHALTLAKRLALSCLEAGVLPVPVLSRDPLLAGRTAKPLLFPPRQWRTIAVPAKG